MTTDTSFIPAALTFTVYSEVDRILSGHGHSIAEKLMEIALPVVVETAAGAGSHEIRQQFYTALVAEIPQHVRAEVKALLPHPVQKRTLEAHHFSEEELQTLSPEQRSYELAAKLFEPIQRRWTTTRRILRAAQENLP